MVDFDGDVGVAFWRNRLGKSAGWRIYYNCFRKFYDDVLVKEFPGYSPSMIVEWQGKAVGRDRYRIVELAQAYIESRGGRVSYKQSQLSYVRSFFMHNRADLPEDKSYHFHSDIMPVDGKLSVDAFKRILLNCNQKFRAVFLMMAQGLMGEDQFVYVNTHYAPDVLEHIAKNDGVFKLTLPGRKQNKGIKNFYILLSTKGDWADEFRKYLKTMTLERDVLFRSDEGQPLSKQALRGYFFRRAVEVGVIKSMVPKCSCCQGENIKVRRKHSETCYRLVYRCRECGHEEWASKSPKNPTSNRYGVNPHEIRDLMRSLWRESGANLTVGEFLMGHTVDPNEYDKIEYTPQHAITEYKKFLPYANLLSCDPRKIDRSQVDEALAETKAQVEGLRRELASFKANPVLADIQQLMQLPGFEGVFKELTDDVKNQFKEQLKKHNIELKD